MVLVYVIGTIQQCIVRMCMNEHLVLLVVAEVIIKCVLRRYIHDRFIIGWLVTD
jgi:hypothetical protein